MESIVGKQFKIVCNQIVQNNRFYDERIDIKVRVTPTNATQTAVIWCFCNSVSSNVVFFTKYTFSSWRTTKFSLTNFFLKPRHFFIRFVRRSKTNGSPTCYRAYFMAESDSETGSRCMHCTPITSVCIPISRAPGWRWLNGRDARRRWCFWVLDLVISVDYYRMKNCECWVSFYTVCIKLWLSPVVMLSYITAYNENIIGDYDW